MSRVRKTHNPKSTKSSQWKKKGFVNFLSCGKGLIFGTKRVIARKVNKIFFSPVRASREASSLRFWVISDSWLKVAIWRIFFIHLHYSVSESFSVLIKHGIFGKKYFQPILKHCLLTFLNLKFFCQCSVYEFMDFS